MITASNHIELHKEDMKFSAAHFTIFSAENRENMHGHNYNVFVSFAIGKSEEGLSVDYRLYKQILRDICKQIDEVIILPGKCKYIDIQELESHFQVTFNTETMLLLKRDVVILPINNVTVEELSEWFIQQLIRNEINMVTNIHEIKVKISSSPGQSGTSTWSIQ